MKTRLFPSSLIIVLLIALFQPLTAYAKVHAQLDRSQAYEGDPVTLTIESDSGSSQPDLSALEKDFRVLGNSKSHQVSIINGRMSEKTSWTIELEPRHKGRLQIPSIKLGKEQTQALELTVSEIPEEVLQQQSEHIFIEVEGGKKGTAYVLQQIPYTVRLFYDDQVLNGDLQAPQPENAVVEQLGDDRNYSVTRNGHRYRVLERHYAISPEKSGSLQIPAVSFRGRMLSKQQPERPLSQSDRLMQEFFHDSPFMRDPFFRAPLNNSGQPIRTQSKSVIIDVQPRPASAGNQWLPAEEISLHDSWTENPPEFRSGEPVTRTLTIEARGLTAAQLPELQLPQPEQTRIYSQETKSESTTDGEKIYGISQQTFTYIPARTGQLIIPEVTLKWWNTDTDQAAISRLPKWEFTVAKGSGTEQQPAPVTSTDEPVQTPQSKASAEDKNVSTVTEPVPDTDWRWLIAASILISVVIGTILLQRYRRKPPVSSDTGTRTPASRVKELLPQLEQACLQNNARDAARILLKLGRIRWPGNPPQNLGALATRLGQGREQVMLLDRALYTEKGSDWKGKDLWLAVKDDWHDRSTTHKPASQRSFPFQSATVST